MSASHWWLLTKNDAGQEMLICCHSLGNACHLGKEGDGIAKSSSMAPVTHIIYRGKARKVRA